MMASMGLASCNCCHAARHDFHGEMPRSLASSVWLIELVRHELVQRRVDKADR